MNRSVKFWNRIATRYSKKPVADEATYQKKLQITREYLQKDMEVMEFGCGTGSTAIAHAPYVKHILAIDFSEKMIEIAQAKAAANNIQNITFKASSIDELGMPEKTLDVVLGLSVLHLLDNKEETIAKVYKMLKSDGTFVTSTACIGDMSGFFKFVAPIMKFVGMPSVKVFTSKQLVESLTDSGFKVDYQWQPGRNKAVFIIAKKT